MFWAQVQVVAAPQLVEDELLGRCRPWLAHGVRRRALLLRPRTPRSRRAAGRAAACAELGGAGSGRGCRRLLQPSQGRLAGSQVGGQAAVAVVPQQSPAGAVRRITCTGEPQCSRTTSLVVPNRRWHGPSHRFEVACTIDEAHLVQAPYRTVAVCRPQHTKMSGCLNKSA